jgi:hypothetical protein
MQYTKAVHKQMRELANLAYERELRLELEKLAEQFQSWKENKIDAFDLEHHIHEFHNGVAREIYSRYNDLAPEMILPYALIEGLICDEECPTEILEDMREIGILLYGERAKR